METLEKEASSRQQSQEAYKRKSVECQQREEDLRVTVQKYLAQLNEAQTSVQEKASAYEQVSFRHQRLQVGRYSWLILNRGLAVYQLRCGIMILKKHRICNLWRTLERLLSYCTINNSISILMSTPMPYVSQVNLFEIST